MLPCNLRLSPLLRTWVTSPPSTPASFAPSPFWAQIETQACGLLDQPGRNSRETLPESPDPPSKPPGQLPKPYTHIQDSQLHPKLYGNTTTWPRKCHCASQHGTGTSPAPVGAPEPLVPATLCAFLTGQGIIYKDSKARPPNLAPHSVSLWPRGAQGWMWAAGSMEDVYPGLVKGPSCLSCWQAVPGAQTGDHPWETLPESVRSGFIQRWVSRMRTYSFLLSPS